MYSRTYSCIGVSLLSQMAKMKASSPPKIQHRSITLFLLITLPRIPCSSCRTTSGEHDNAAFHTPSVAMFPVEHRCSRCHGATFCANVPCRSSACLEQNTGEISLRVRCNLLDARLNPPDSRAPRNSAGKGQWLPFRIRASSYCGMGTQLFRARGHEERQRPGKYHGISTEPRPNFDAPTRVRQSRRALGYLQLPANHSASGEMDPSCPRGRSSGTVPKRQLVTSRAANDSLSGAEPTGATTFDRRMSHLGQSGCGREGSDSIASLRLAHNCTHSGAGASIFVH
jgi:hypothetical protein